MFDVSLLKLGREKDGKLPWDDLALHKGVRCYLSTKVKPGPGLQQKLCDKEVQGGDSPPVLW